MVQWIRSVVVQRLSPATVFRHGMEVFEMLCVFAGGYGCTPQSSVSAGLYSVTCELHAHVESQLRAAPCHGLVSPSLQESIFNLFRSPNSILV